VQHFVLPYVAGPGLRGKGRNPSVLVEHLLQQAMRLRDDDEGFKRTMHLHGPCSEVQLPLLLPLCSEVRLPFLPQRWHGLHWREASVLLPFLQVCISVQQ
jgi:hypothetical protein